MKLLRGAVLLLGFGVLGVLGAVEHTLRRRGVGSPQPTPADSGAEWLTASFPPPTAVVARVRLVLGALGVLAAAYGVYVLVGVLPLASYLALALWLLGANVLHDAVLVPAVSVLRAGAHRAGRRLPVIAVRLAEAAFFLVGAVTLLAVPEIYAQHLGSNNPTVLPGSYGRALLATSLVVAAVTGLVITAVWLRARRSNAARGGSGLPFRPGRGW